MRRMWSDLTSPPPMHPTADWNPEWPPRVAQTWPGRDADEAFGRRLTAVSDFTSFNLDAKRCVLSPARIVLVGTGEFPDLKYSGDALASVFYLVGWTLLIVYGHKDIECHAPPLVDLRLSLAEARR